MTRTVPEDFKQQARDLLLRFNRTIGPEDADLRRSLLGFIGDFANWDNSSQPTYLEVGRGLVKTAHGEEPPLVVDPFAGGRLDSPGSLAPGLRGLRQRPQSSGLPYPQGHAGGHPTLRAGTCRPNCAGLVA